MATLRWNREEISDSEILELATQRKREQQIGSVRDRIERRKRTKGEREKERVWESGDGGVE